MSSVLKWSVIAVFWASLGGCDSTAEGDGEPSNECDADFDDCAAGYQCEETADGFVCQDIDECASGEFDCGVGFLCENTPGGYECVDADECADGTHSCDPLAGICFNTEGGFECECEGGWYLADDDETCIYDLVLGSHISSAQSGQWDSPGTWEGGQVPQEGDWVTIIHDVTVPADVSVEVGHSPPAGDARAAISIPASGTLTLDAGSTLNCRGDLITSGNVTLEAGATLQLDATHALDRFASIYLLEIKPGTTDAHLLINGASGAYATVRSNEDAAHARITDGGLLGGGRIVAERCVFSGLGGHPDYRAWSYSPRGDGTPYSINSCLFERCSQVKSDELIPAGGSVEFITARWRDSVVKPIEERDPLEEWGIFETGAEPGANVKVVRCDFDVIASLFFYEGYTIERNVFRSGILGFSHWGGKLDSFRHNFVRWNSDEAVSWGIPGGIALEDSVFIVEPSGCGEPDEPAICWNPHFAHMRADGGAEIIGNVWWWTGTDPAGEGDGIILRGAESGTRADNWYLFEKNIYLPNGNGPDAGHNVSATPFTILDSTDNFEVIFQRNTVYSGHSFGGCAIGEDGVTHAGDIGYLKSNLFVGSIDSKGYKIYNLGNAEPDAMPATAADYNASYRINPGTDYGPGAGKGYFDLEFNQAGTVGANDIDDVNPDFIDPTRTPASWDASLGGEGTLEGAMDRVSPGGQSTMVDLLQYIREGFRPQNEALRGAGDPGGFPASPDIGAVDMSP